MADRIISRAATRTPYPESTFVEPDPPALRPRVEIVEVERELPAAPATVLLPQAGYADRAKGFSIATAPLAASYESHKDQKAEYDRVYRETNKERKAANDRAYREANKEHIAAYREANREHIAEQARRYREANRAQISANYRAYREANRERRIAYCRAWRAANQDRVIAYRRQWYEANRERLFVWRREYYAAHSDEVKESARQGRCYYCGGDLGDAYHVDHIIPLSRGGTNWPENLVIACPSCNNAKGDKLPHEWPQGGRLL